MSSVALLAYQVFDLDSLVTKRMSLLEIIDKLGRLCGTWPTEEKISPQGRCCTYLDTTMWYFGKVSYRGLRGSNLIT